MWVYGRGGRGEDVKRIGTRQEERGGEERGKRRGEERNEARGAERGGAIQE